MVYTIFNPWSLENAFPCFVLFKFVKDQRCLFYSSRYFATPKTIFTNIQDIINNNMYFEMLKVSLDLYSIIYC